MRRRRFGRPHDHVFELFDSFATRHRHHQLPMLLAILVAAGPTGHNTTRVKRMYPWVPRIFALFFIRLRYLYSVSLAIDHGPGRQALGLATG
jgi:hypothetical protein